MSRFHILSAFLVITVPAIAFSTQGLLRWTILCILFALYLAIFALGVSIVRLNFFVRAVCRGKANGLKHVALTFDDGPDPKATPRLLDLLDLYGIRAGFFVIGGKAAADPVIVKDIERRGHVVGNHSYRHVWWTNFLTGRRLDQEIRRTQDAIRAATGKTPAFYRPPVGLTNPHLGNALRRAGLVVIGWDVRPFDTCNGPDTVIRRVLKRVRDGSIIVLHDGGQQPAHLACLVEGLAQSLPERGYAFADLETVTGLDAYQSGVREDTQHASGIRRAWQMSLSGRGRVPRFLRFLALLMADTAYVQQAVAEPVDLGAFRERPSPRFLTGISLVLFSYVLGWPMVGLFSFLAAWWKKPVLLIGGPVSYGLSYLVWLLGMFLGGRDSIRYADVFFRWWTRRAVETVLGKTDACRTVSGQGPQDSSGSNDER